MGKEKAQEWAFNRALEIVDAETSKGWTHKFVPIGAVEAFARYIAAHEEAPVDPLLLEAREILAAARPGFADQFKAGFHDYDISIPLIIKGLNRGIEIAGGGNG